MTQEERESVRFNLRVMWRAIYWFTYLMCWTVLPILMYYLNSAEYSFRARIIYSIKRLLVFYSIGFLFLLIFILYIAFRNDDNFLGYFFSFLVDFWFRRGLQGFLITLGNTWFAIFGFYF